MSKQMLIIVLAIVGMVVIGIAAFLYYVPLGLPGTDIDETDFETDAERIAFMQEILTVPIPPDVTDIRLHYAAFTDWYLDASFRLPPASREVFRRALEKHTLERPNRWCVEHADTPADYEWYELDPATGAVTASYVRP